MPRPEISEDVIQEVEDLTDAYFRVPDTKVSFEDRVRELAKEFQKAKERDSKGPTVVNPQDVQR